MRVTKVQQENTSKSSSVLKAGLIGAATGTVVRNLTPLTTEEHNFFFNASAQAAIKEKVQKVRLNEVESIKNEFKNGSSAISQQAYDVFVKNKDAVVDEPKKALDLVKDSSDAIKNGFKSLVSRVDAVGAAKEHIETTNIKNAAKASRPLGYFIAAGALIAMSAQVMINAFKSSVPQREAKKEEPQELTMADVLLEGLGSNTEVLFLASEMNRK